ncbi:conjugal transfer protein TraG N-terminal domain-containing protein [Acinetobacter sp. SwsAc5]|uniref:conjugal transfer protein TraG N-terminal domain-containing protein n=1 Tax=Acinetobacter sp. SwsAc5 TaxID=2749438 RepID=UPI0015BC660C|nr:conjugal transfer protein TraG N-terminal domain-containing protein [Acinetobacter sp. SwsAc5]NWK51957.1 conjugal transfer protein TraG N-terminal domain-containing protein [Acinetobacter sp. SwsAc5]
MEFEIYTLGDTQLYWDVLNGIAMIFSGSDLVSGTNGMNLSFGAFVGAMILLCVMIFKAVFQREIELRTLLLPLTIYMVLTVPKASVVVNDIYNVEPIKRIDNVPLGLALPASAFSGFAFLLTQILEQSLEVLPLDGSVSRLPKMTEEGFLTPLQVLNQVRYDDMNRAYPAFQQTVTSLYNECLVNNPAFNAQQYQQNTNSFDYLLKAAQNSNGMVIVYQNMAGETVPKAMSCNEASDSIRTTFGAYIDGSTDIFNMLNMSIAKNSFKDRLAKRLSHINTYGKVNTVNGIGHYTPAQITDMVGSSIGINTDRARTFMTMVTFDPLVKTAASCVENFNTFNLSMCTGWITANEQWKQSATMSGTSFLKNLKNGQNLLVMVGFLLFPIMVFMVMIQGMGSAKLIAGYVCFMMSNFLWLPFATIINFYAQSEFQEAAYLLMSQDPNASLTLAQAPQLYDALSQKIAVASNALGMVPVLTTMLFGGMMWGMSAMASSMNPADAGYNAKLNSKTIKDSAALSTSSSVLNRDGYGGTTIQGVGNVNVKMEGALSAAQSQTREISARQEQILSRMAQISDKANNSIGQSQGSAHGNKSTRSSGTVTEHSIGGGSNESFAVGDTNDTNKNDTTKEQNLQVIANKQAQTALQGDLSITGNAGGQLNGTGGNGLKGLIKNSSFGASVTAGPQVSAATGGNSNVTVSESNIGDGTEKPTAKNSHGNIDNLRISNADANINSGKEATYKLTGSSNYDFAAERLNEQIQNSRSATITASEQQESQRLLEEMRTLSQQKQQIYSSVLSNAVSDRDLAGMMNDLYPRSQAVKKGLDDIDQLGKGLVNRWDELKEMGERNARLGGHHDQQTIEKLGIFFAATNSNNSDVTLAAISTVSGIGLSDRFNENSSMYNIQGGNDHINAMNSNIRNDGITNKDINALDKAERNNISPERMGQIVDKSIIATAAAVGLSNKELKDAENNVVVDYKHLNYEQERARIQSGYEKDAKILVEKKDLGLTNPDGTLKDPKLNDPVNGKILKTTEYDDQLKEAVERGDRNAVVEILTKENEVLTGIDAQNQAAAIRAAALESIPQDSRPSGSTKAQTQVD